MQLKDIEVGQEFIAGMVHMKKLEPVELDGFVRNVKIIGETGSPMLPKGMILFLHPDTSIDRLVTKTDLMRQAAEDQGIECYAIN